MGSSIGDCGGGGGGGWGRGGGFWSRLFGRGGGRQPAPTRASADFYATPRGATLSRATLARQGTSPRVGDFTDIEGASVDEIVARVPKDWQWSPMDDELSSIGGGIKFRSPDGLREIRIHGPTTNPDVIARFPNAPGVQGWTARVGYKYDSSVRLPGPTEQYVDRYGFYYVDTRGRIVPLQSDAGHIPIQGNPYLAQP